MNAKRILAVLAVCVMLCLLLAWQWLVRTPQPRTFATPAAPGWQPVGQRKANAQASAVLPLPDSFHTMHADSANTDELWSVVAPAFEPDWLAETGLYLPEAPTFDNRGQLYFSPTNAREDVSLVALDTRTGKRLWSVPGRGAGNGSPLILNNPDVPGEQLIYHSTYETAMALRHDGSPVWQVSTGLQLPERQPGKRSQTHIWGMNYQPQADALLLVSMDGWVVALDRRTGRALLSKPFQLPGAPAPVREGRIARWLTDRANAETDATFGATTDGLGLFTSVLDVIYGNGVNVANTYAVDPNSGSIIVAATAPDEQDGAADGVSQNGAIYRLELAGNPADGYQLKIADHFYFVGGTGSSPTVRADGALVVVSDENGNVIALDKHLHELWRINVGQQVAASVAVSVEGGEMYVVTAEDVIKLRDLNDHAEIVWRARLDAYPGFDNANALTPTITANGILISVGAGRLLQNKPLLSKFGMGLLDRETGELRWFAEGREESIAASTAGPDGAIYVAHSPIRRAIVRGLFGDRVPALVGGIQRHKPIQLNLMARDAVCAAGGYARRMGKTTAAASASLRDDWAQINLLLRQTAQALAQAEQRKELTLQRTTEWAQALQQVQADLAAQRIDLAAEQLGGLCASAE
ncbi:outer membrane protein assembly factor BamB family protein [Pseudomonas sp. N040]|uniref:outer membrane protein assembly factor BamB family protein n=1 Tax=Pseudomonas sp. N040 TaxID=2785325 RepID=UPI0018A24E91|nr:PQQ-binding-like beta-propeller repeat protein [Pseudomonas sp. N040]MBF7729578.1 PQQ-binding-like beta-propeller repeat protein [Pseudomonas sp. N040]MBW7013218.1 PQQ-binding-like beta-propeller repeat protein [Pseudomonas sp. N040]